MLINDADANWGMMWLIWFEKINIDLWKQILKVVLTAAGLGLCMFHKAEVPELVLIWNIKYYAI